jgi:hypothetical protein
MSTVWLQYALGDGLSWPSGGSLDKNTILQLDLLCRRLGKYSEVPYVQVFMAFCMNPRLDHYKVSILAILSDLTS